LYDLLIGGGTVVTAAGEWDLDLAVQHGRIAAIGSTDSLGPARQVIDAQGKHVLPGLIDSHVHFREPGFTYKEDFQSGTMAAAAGGVTTAMAIPNTNPPLTTPESFRVAVDLAKKKAVVDFAIFAGASMATPEALSLFADSGAIGFDLCDNPFEYGSAHWIELFDRVRSSCLPLCFYLSDDVLRDYGLRQLGCPVWT